MTESQYLSELAQLLDELVDPVITCRQARVFLDHCDCDHVVVVVLVSCSWFLRCVSVVWLFFFFFFFCKIAFNVSFFLCWAGLS